MLAIAGGAMAQVAEPNQRIPSLATFREMPELSALRSRVFASWGGAEYAYSLNSALTWTNETGLPILPPFNEIETPTTSCIALDGTTHLATDHFGMQYFRGSGFSPITWANPVIALDVYTSGFAGYDVPSIGCDPTLGYVYLSTTEGQDNSQFTSTILFTRSLDNGTTWQLPLRISSPNCKGPSLAVGLDGTLYVTYVDYALGQVLMRRSTDHGTTFLPPVVVAGMLDNLLTPPIGWRFNEGSLGGRLYPYYLDSGFAPNFPALAVDKSSGSTRGNLYVTWADCADGVASPATTIVGDAGNNDTFATAQPVPLDCDISGFLPDAELGNGESDVYVFEGTAGQTVWISGSATNGGSYSLLHLELPDGSKLFVGHLWLLDPNAITGVAHTKPTIFTLPRTGRYYLSLFSQVGDRSYTLQLRSYLPSASSVARDMRDIVLVRSIDGGATWSGKLRVNHDPPGADQAMPNVAVDGVGNVYVGWYDRRDAAAGDSVHAYAAVSGDGGRSFGTDLRLSSVPSSWSGPPPSPPEPSLNPGELIGDRIAVAAGDDYGIVAWADLRDWNSRSDIYAARIVEVPTAVNAVSDLTADPGPDGVRLTWTVNDARAVTGLRVYRAPVGDGEVALGTSDLIPTHEGKLEYFDTTTEPGVTYEYRLQVRSGGRIDWLGPVTVTMPARITSLAWRAAWPNPFARRTSVKLEVPRVAEGSVRVYDVQGKQVRTLSAGRFEAGEHVLEWDGCDGTGGIAAPGLYFVTAQVGGERTQLRVARIP